MLLLFVLFGCATQPGKAAPDDFITRQIHLAIPPPQALTQLRDGFRYCGPGRTTPVTATAYGIPDCLVNDDGSAVCHIYYSTFLGGRSAHLLGRIEMRPSATGTEATLRRVNRPKLAAGKAKTLDAWELFLRGKAAEACPD